MTDSKLEELAAQLATSDDYRVLRRLANVARYHDPADADGEIRIGIYLDTETTGLDSQSDRIIELAMVPFEFTPDGRIYRVLEAFDQFEDPGMPIPAEIVELTGITDAMVRDQEIDDGKVATLVETAAVIIAHNASFDRRFVETRLPVFESKAWACSSAQVPWREQGIESNKLEYIAYRSGFFYSGHRAENDCRAGIEILSQVLPVTGEPALKALLDNARSREVRLWAVNSPFDCKDVLKGRGYRWNSGDDGRPKSWYRDLPETEVATELEFLKSDVFGRDVTLPTDSINAFNRFSARI